MPATFLFGICFYNSDSLRIIMALARTNLPIKRKERNTMDNNRIVQIKKSLEGLGTKEGELYSNQELIKLYTEFQQALANGVFEKTHAEKMRDRDVVVHLEALAKEYGLDETSEFLRFKKNMAFLGSTFPARSGTADLLPLS